MTAWRLAGSLEELRLQLDVAYPDRDRASDGTIGDAAHASRTSDHNPWVVDGDGPVVTAMDITHDPAGPQGPWLAELARLDPRTKYVIHAGRIANGGASWFPYNGENPHTGHVHVSVLADRPHYDDRSLWQLFGSPGPTPDGDDVPYLEWPDADRNKLLDDIRLFSIGHVTVPVFAGASGPESLLECLSRLSRIERTLWDVTQALAALAGGGTVAPSGADPGR